MTTPKKTSTKTTTPTYAERVEGSKHELAEAIAGLVAAEADMQAAQDAVKDLRVGGRAGDLTVTEEALMKARTAVTIRQDRLTYATDRLKRAERSVLNDDTTIAKAVAAALEGYGPLTGITVVSTAETPTMPKTITSPVLHLVQVAAPKHDVVSGRSSGLVEAYLHRPTWGVSLSVEDLPDHLAREQVYADARSHGTRKVGDVCEDRASLSVGGVWQSVPVIDKPRGAERFGQTLAGSVAGHLSLGRRGNIAQAREGGLGSTTARASAVMAQGEGRITGTTANGGERRTTVEVTMALQSSVLGNSAISQEATAYLKGRVGMFESGLGRVASVEMVPTDKGSSPHAPMRLGVRFVFLSVAR